MKKVLIMVPAYNEEGAILETVETIRRYRKNNILDFELDWVVINDGSKDKTQEIIENNHINHVNLVANLGIGGAVQTGYKYAMYNDYDVAVQFDGDGQHDITEIKKLVSPILRNDSDFVIGSRFVDNEKENFKSTVMRRVGINLISFFIKALTGKKIYDTTSGYRAVNKEIICLFAEDYPQVYPEPQTTTLVALKKMRISELPVNMFERTTGESSITPFKSIIYMMDVLSSIVFTKINFFRRK